MAKKSEKNEQVDDKAAHAPTIRNRKAFHDYFISQQVEAGLVLTGTEVKSLRMGQCQLDDAYASIRGGEVWLIGANIATYPQAVGMLQHDPVRPRKCLLRRRQIAELARMTAQKGLTMVPLRVFFSHGLAKIELGVGEGKRQYDKRDDIKKRQAKRDMDREMRRRD